MLRLLVQRDEGVGVRRVPGLGALGLRHVQLVEQHHLQLLGRAEVDLATDLRVGELGGRVRLGGERRLQILEIRDVDGDPVALHDPEHPHHRQLDVGEQR